MLTFLFALASIWTLFWLVMLMLDWGKYTPITNNTELCPTCPHAINPGSTTTESTNAPAAKNDTTYNKTASLAQDNTPTSPATATNLAATSTASDNIEKQPVSNTNNQSSVKPLFEKPKEIDDLKVIKGIGVVMEQTLNDLGITTFKQLASFKQAEVKMVSDALSESNSGFGDRIERDEWVDQAKKLVNQAG